MLDALLSDSMELDGEEEVAESQCGDFEVPAHSRGESFVSAATAAAWPPRRVHARNASCPAALRYSVSSSALDALSDAEDDPATPPAWSPALQASIAAWQSATSLLQELQVLQQAPGAAMPPQELMSQPPPPACGGLSHQQLVLLTPEQQREHLAQQQQQKLAPAQPTWLQSALVSAQEQQMNNAAGGCEGAAPELRGASEGAVPMPIAAPTLLAS